MVIQISASFWDRQALAVLFQKWHQLRPLYVVAKACCRRISSILGIIADVEHASEPLGRGWLSKITAPQRSRRRPTASRMLLEPRRMQKRTASHTRRAGIC